MKKLFIILGVIALVTGIFLGGKLVPNINTAIQHSQEKNDITVSTGIGETYDWAIMNAIENAVRQTSTIKITQDSPMHFGRTNQDIDTFIKTINAKYAGEINSYKVLSSKEKMGKFYVTIEAAVKKPAKLTEYKIPNLAKGDIPTVAILDFKANNSYSCGSSNFSKTKLNKYLANSLNEKLGKSKKFEMVSRKDFDNYAKEIALINKGLSPEESKAMLKKISIADYILVGEVMSFNVIDNSEIIDMTGEKNINIKYKISISYKLLETASMKIITSGIAITSFTSDNENISCNSVLRRLNKDVSAQISDSILNNLFYHSYESAELKTVKKTLKDKVKKRLIKRTEFVNKEEKAPVIKLPFDK